jgi:hypothetical protein
MFQKGQKVHADANKIEANIALVFTSGKHTAEEIMG